MKTLRLFIVATLLPLSLMAQKDLTTLTKIGDTLPNFAFEIERNKTVHIADYKGKLILINFFATWCGPCHTELNAIQENFREKFKSNPHFAFFAFGREESWDVITPFKKKKGFTFHMLPDQDRSIFNHFATQSIPRNIIADENGKIIYQSTGYSEPAFLDMLKFIEKRLKKMSKE
jgi:peroxiredoxin